MLLFFPKKFQPFLFISTYIATHSTFFKPEYWAISGNIQLHNNYFSLIQHIAFTLPVKMYSLGLSGFCWKLQANGQLFCKEGINTLEILHGRKLSCEFSFNWAVETILVPGEKLTIVQLCWFCLGGEMPSFCIFKPPNLGCFLENINFISTNFITCDLQIQLITCHFRNFLFAQI